jgi:uncharacterized peroxidase-related enzyme
MSFIKTVPKSEATGALKELYELAENEDGFIPSYLKTFSHRPEVYLAWQKLGRAIRQNMTLRRYELVTLAAARTLEGTYCMLAHGENFLNSGEVDETQLAAIAEDYHRAGLTTEEVAVMEFAEKIITRSSSVTQADVDHLRSFGITDAEILDITLAAAARSFFSKAVDALNAEPDAKYMKLNAHLRNALVIGRPLGIPEESAATS